MALRNSVYFSLPWKFWFFIIHIRDQVVIISRFFAWLLHPCLYKIFVFKYLNFLFIQVFLLKYIHFKSTTFHCIFIQAVNVNIFLIQTFSIKAPKMSLKYAMPIKLLKCSCIQGTPGQKTMLVVISKWFYLISSLNLGRVGLAYSINGYSIRVASNHYESHLWLIVSSNVCSFRENAQCHRSLSQKGISQSQDMSAVLKVLSTEMERLAMRVPFFSCLIS